MNLRKPLFDEPIHCGFPSWIRVEKHIFSWESPHGFQPSNKTVDPVQFFTDFLKLKNEVRDLRIELRKMKKMPHINVATETVIEDWDNEDDARWDDVL